MQGLAWCLLLSVLGAAEPEAIVLEFTAPSRCFPCQQIAPTVARLQREGFPIRAIDIDSNPRANSQHRINAVPTFLLLIGGREVDRLEGKPSESELRRMCERARLSNTAATTDRAAVRDAESAPTNDMPAKSEIRNPKSEISNLKSGSSALSPQPSALSPSEPIIRAKHDDHSATLPPANSTDPLHLCVRIRVKDSLGVNFGTGTIIDSCEGRTIILTCGHIFRKLDDRSVIEADVFGGSRPETFVGRVLRYDLEADVGLMVIPTNRPLPTAIVSGLSAASTIGQHVFSVGCSGGEMPSKLQHRVTAFNRYLGPDNVECTGLPIQGRSGGGLFDTQGRLVGVCIAADPRDQRGLYAGLKPIHALLDQVQLAHLYPQAEPRPHSNMLAAGAPPTAESAKPTKKSAATSADEPPFDNDKNLTTTLAGLADGADVTASPFAVVHSTDESPLTVRDPALVAVAGPTAPPIVNASELRSALDETGEAEVVCIIRPLKNARASSRVVIINRASTRFLSQLTGELEQQAKPTSAVVRQAKYVTTETVVPRPYRRVK